MKEVSIGKGKTTIIDDDDYEFLKNFKWKYRLAKNNVETVQATVRLHTLVAVLHKFNHKAVVDHKDGNRLNNQKSNLRAATREENSRNMKVRQNTTGYKGVYPNRSGSRFVAKIYINKTQTHLGTFPDKISAAKAYDEAAIQHFGEFARTNFNK